MSDDGQRVYVVLDCSAAGCALLAIFSTEPKAEAYRTAREAECVALFGDEMGASAFTYEVEVWVVDEQEGDA